MNTTMRKDHYFEMSMIGEDRQTLAKVINQGIDSRLEAFTKSEFRISNSRLFCWIHESELSILLRRLLELENDAAELLADDIVIVQYGYNGY